MDLTNFTYEKFQWCVNQLGFYISFAEPYSDDDFFENYLMLATFGSGKGKDAHNSVVGTLKTKKTWKSSKNDPSRLLLATPNFDPETGSFLFLFLFSFSFFLKKSFLFQFLFKK